MSIVVASVIIPALIIICLVIFIVVFFVLLGIEGSSKKDIKKMQKNGVLQYAPNEPIITTKDDAEAEEPNPTEEQEPTQEPMSEEELREQIRSEVLAEIEEKNEEKSSKGARILSIALVAIQNIFLVSTLDWENALGVVTFLLGIVGIVLLLVSFKDPVGKMTPMISVSLTCLTIEMVFLGVPPIGSLGVVFVLLDALGVYNKLRKRKK